MKLMIYKGGGSDSCFWEWNACLLNEDGTFQVSLFYSGYNGINNQEELDMSEREESRLYSLMSVDDAKKFHTDDWNPSVQLMVMEALDREQEPHVLYVTCDTCGQEFQSPEDVFSDGYRGCGGIAICACGIICHECLDQYSCRQCGERVGEEVILDDEGRCEGCARGELADKQEELQQLIIDRGDLREIGKLNDSILCYMQYLEETFGKEEE